MGVVNCSNDSSDSHALRTSERATRSLSGIVPSSVECEKRFPSWNCTRAYYAQIDPRLRPLDEVGDNCVGDHVVCLTDLFATVPESIGIPLPADAGPDSFSWVSIFNNPSAAPVRPSTIHHSINGSFAIRKGRYKLCFCSDSGGWSDPKPKTKPILGDGLQLFDLEEELQETKNLANDLPDLGNGTMHRPRQEYAGRETP